MPPPLSEAPISLDVHLRGEELLAAWRADSRRLVLRAREPLRVRQRVAARITGVGPGVAATITGRIASAARDGDSHRLELVPDDMRLRALERLLAIARGEVVRYQPRAPRILATLPAVVHGPAGPTYMTTFSLSENGCGLAWSGSPPSPVGDPLDLRLGAGGQAVVFRSVVCWTARSGNTTTVGVRFLAGARDTWAMVLDQARRAGAPPA